MEKEEGLGQDPPFQRFYLSKEERSLHQYSYYNIKKNNGKVQAKPIKNDVLPLDKSIFGSISDRVKRGGGRDYIDFESEVMIKGAGTNQSYSFQEKSFSLGDFRSNGLLRIERGVIEFSIAKILKKIGVPASPYQDLILFPDDLLSFYKQKKSKTFIYKNTPVQLVRSLSLRESNVVFQFSKTEYLEYLDTFAIPLISQMTLHNIGHGAINHENIGYGGKLLDLGHVTLGLPIYSTTYRCLSKECRSYAGSALDGSMVGILDHYFGQSYLGDWWERKAKSFLESDFDFQKKLIHQLLKDIDVKKSHQLGEIAGFSSLLANNMRISKKLSTFVSSFFPHAKFHESAMAGSVYSPSVKFMFQVSYMKTIVPSEDFKNFSEGFDDLFTRESDAEQFWKLVDSFSHVLSDLRPQKVVDLFTHYYPLNQMEEIVNKELSQVDSYSDLVEKSSNLLTKLESSFYVDPKNFFYELKNFLLKE